MFLPCHSEKWKLSNYAILSSSSQNIFASPCTYSITLKWPLGVSLPFKAIQALSVTVIVGRYSYAIVWYGAGFWSFCITPWLLSKTPAKAAVGRSGKVVEQEHTTAQLLPIQLSLADKRSCTKGNTIYEPLWFDNVHTDLQLAGRWVDAVDRIGSLAGEPDNSTVSVDSVTVVFSCSNHSSKQICWLWSPLYW